MPEDSLRALITLEGGKGFHFTGHHEILFPLFYTSLIQHAHPAAQAPFDLRESRPTRSSAQMK